MGDTRILDYSSHVLRFFHELPIHYWVDVVLHVKLKLFRFIKAHEREPRRG